MASRAPGFDARSIRFGPFTADVRTRELRKHGRRIRLPGLPFELLLALVERPGELVTRDELRARLWADGTFVDFDNNLNAAVTRLRQTLGDSAEDPRYIETLPRLGYRFIGTVDVSGGADAGSAAPAAAAAGAAADGSAAVVPGVPSAPPSSRRRYLIVAGAAAAAVAVVAIASAWRTARHERAADPSPAMLAVLPFENLSGNPDQEFFSDGITEELIAELARLDPPRLGIIARTTSFKYKGARKSVAEIARELGTAYVIEGSVRRDGDRVRVTAQLIESSRQTHLWAESYDRTIQDVLDVERDIAQAVARAVRVAVETPPARPQSAARVSAAGHDAFLRARFYASQATVKAVEQAIAHYRQAVSLEPGYAVAHAGLSRVLIFATQSPPAVALRDAQEAAARALAIDPALPEARLAWAMTLLYRDRDLPAAGAAFDEALALDPGSAEVHFYYAQYLTASGRFDEALRAAGRAQQLDPFSPLIHHYVGRILLFARRPAEARDHLRRTLELEPNYGWALLFSALAYEELGDFAQATAMRQKYWAVMGVAPERIHALGETYTASGYAAVRRAWIDWIEGFATRTGYVTSTELALLYTAIGDYDQALHWLGKAVDNHTRDLIYLRVYPDFAPLRTTPGFRALEARVFPGPV